MCFISWIFGKCSKGYFLHCISFYDLFRSSPTQTLSRPKSSRSLRPLSAKSNASQVSVESATGRYRVKSASERGKASQISLKLPTDNLTPRHNGDRLSRPGSAASSIASVNSLRSETDESETSEFYGGRRMEALLQVLHHEPDSGGFFKRYVERSDNKVYIVKPYKNRQNKDLNNNWKLNDG